MIEKKIDKKIKFRYWLKCIACNREFPADNNHYTCPSCGQLLLVERDEEFIANYLIGGGRGRIAQNYFDGIRFGRLRQCYPYGSGVWMWINHLLPGFPIESVLSLREGFTDLFEPPQWLKREIGLNNLYVKLTGQNPSGSFKDYGMTVAVSMARWLQIYKPDLGIKFISCASTGDTSAAAAQYAAYFRDHLRCLVFLPADKISEGQLAQVMMSGAIIVAIKHPEGFDGCMKLIKKFCSKYSDIVLVNSANAFRLVGQEAIALEIFQDLRWQAPDWISIPCGNGGNLTALLISCLRAKNLGLIDRLPSIIIAQTSGANTLVRWENSGFKNYTPGKFQNSIASAMNIQDPVSFPRIKQLYSQFNIKAFDVNEDQIQRVRAQFNRAAIDICPQGAVAVNAVMQARASNSIVKDNDTVVTISTASSLKFVDSAIDYHLHGSQEVYNYANPYLLEETGTIEGIEKLLMSQKK